MKTSMVLWIPFLSTYVYAVQRQYVLIHLFLLDEHMIHFLSKQYSEMNTHLSQILYMATSLTIWTEI